MNYIQYIVLQMKCTPLLLQLLFISLQTLWILNAVWLIDESCNLEKKNNHLISSLSSFCAKALDCIFEQSLWQKQINLI